MSLTLETNSLRKWKHMFLPEINRKIGPHVQDHWSGSKGIVSWLLLLVC